MSMPVNNFTWATHANYTTGPDIGTPTKVAPSSGERAEGFVPDTAAVPQYVNYALGEISSWLGYVAGLASDSEFLANNFHFTNDITVDGLLTVGGGAAISGDVTFDAGDVQKYAGAKQYRKVIPLTQFAHYQNAHGVAFISDYTGIYYYNDGTAGAAVSQCFLDLPVGSVLTRVRCGISATGNTPSGGGHRFMMSVDRVTYDTASPTSSNTQGANIDKTTLVAGGFDILDTGPFSAAVNNSSHLRVQINPNNAATSPDRDVLMWVEVEYVSEYFAEQPL